MPNCLILNGHPFTPSFSGAIAGRYAETLAGQGINIRRFDLADMTLPEHTIRKAGDEVMHGDVLAFWEAMVWADHVVIIHPLWWGSMPAKLKALFDIALQSGRAYRYHDGRPLPLGLLKGRSARLMVTSDTPNFFMVLAYGNAHFRTMKNQILKFVGLDPVRISHFSTMRDSTPERRETFLRRTAEVAAADAQRLLRHSRKANPA